jgi:hypothetical protein
MATIARNFGLLTAGAVAIAATSANAHLATARIVTCEAGNCLLVQGVRASLDAVVRINDRVVEVEGGRSWQVRLPVATIQDWSAPFARTLQVSVAYPVGSAERSDAVRLPVGLLGHNLELASLVVRAR